MTVGFFVPHVQHGEMRVLLECVDARDHVEAEALGGRDQSARQIRLERRIAIEHYDPVALHARYQLVPGVIVE